MITNTKIFHSTVFRLHLTKIETTSAKKKVKKKWVNAKNLEGRCSLLVVFGHIL